MASRIESDSPSKALRRQAEAQASPPASSNPAAPGPPKPIPKRAGTHSANDLPGQEQTEDEETRPARRGLFGQIPAWGISVLVHVIAILVMALMVSEPVRIEKPTVITSSVSEAEEDIADLELDQPVQEDVSEVSDPVEVATPEMAIAPDLTVDAVVPVETDTTATDVDAAPLAAIDALDFAAELLPQAGMAEEGGPGGMASGLGARSQPARMAAARGGGADTETAVDLALRWFAEHQLPDGGWHFDLVQCPNCLGKCTRSGTYPGRNAATALALLPFLGRGYTHLEGPYKKQVAAGIGFLVKEIDDDGKAYRPTDTEGMYTQGMVGMVLSECYAMSRDKKLAAPTKAVLKFIMGAQHPEIGGWRYEPRAPEGGDTSVLSWQLMALKSGSMAGIEINPLTIQNASKFLDRGQVDELGATYGYLGKDQPTPSLAAIGVLCRMYLGWPKDHPGIQAAAKDFAALGPTTDLYYDYYATQVMHHVGGKMWTEWNAKMKALLLGTQVMQGHEAGSWFEKVHEKTHRPWLGGRLYLTSLATLTLEVYYRHLPLYSTQSVQEKFRD